jgi:hypothetical protein
VLGCRDDKFARGIAEEGNSDIIGNIAGDPSMHYARVNEGKHEITYFAGNTLSVRTNFIFSDSIVVLG